MEKLKILITDDEEVVRKEIGIFLSKKGFIVFEAATSKDTLNVLNENKIDILILDIRLPDTNGLELLKQIKSSYNDIEVIMITGHGDMDSILEAMRNGAFDFFNKPVNVIDLENSIRRTTKYITLTNRLKEVENNYNLVSKELLKELNINIIGDSQAIKNVIELAYKAISSSDTPVLITGDSGVGKELIARFIHYGSARKNFYFYTLNCSAIPESLIESELFGHVKGSFTGAFDDKIGCFEAGNKGCIFLDEIGDMPLNAQSKLLRVLEDKKIKKIGSTKEIPVDVRVISATNKNLEELIKENKFRLDLFYRLNTFQIHIPSLKERKEDIPILVEYFVKFYSEKLSKNIIKIENEIFNLFKNYEFPGNIRELRNIIERGLILCDRNELKLKHIAINNLNVIADTKEENNNLNLEGIEKKYILKALNKTNNNISTASSLLGISRQALYRKIEYYKIKLEDH